MEHIFHQPQFGEDWFTYPELYTDFVQNYLQNGSVFVEVGSWKGKSISYIGVEIVNSGKDIKCFAVDTWKGTPGIHDKDIYVKIDKLYNLFLANIGPLSNIITPIRKSSIEASKQFEDNSIDIVYIDAGHLYEDVKSDIESWYPKVKPGGIISGHDYDSESTGGDHAGVRKAVDEAFPQNLIPRSGNCWVYFKPKGI